MKWLLFAVWLGLLVGLWSLWKSRTRRNSQARVASQRTSLDCSAYIEEMTSSGVSTNVATVLYNALTAYCFKGVFPNPDDRIFGFYLTYDDDLEDLIPNLYEPLGLPLPAATDADIVPHLESARHLGVFLQGKLDALSQS